MSIVLSTSKQISVSVILPVYNVKPYIERCIESLQAQTVADLEFIFVDDCSADGSMAAVESWAAQDGRVRILRNDCNIGAGPSRNRGIEIARGDYLSFVDADDYISPDFYELLHAAACADGEHDIAKGQRATFFEAGSEQGSLPRSINARIRERVDADNPLYVAFDDEHQSALYHRSLFANNSIRYGTTALSEDITFLLKVCSLTEDIVLAEEATYYYRKRDDSTSHDKGTSDYEAAIDALAESAAFLKSHGLLDDHAYDYLSAKCTHRFTTYVRAMRSSDALAQNYASYELKVLSFINQLPEPTEVLYRSKTLADLGKKTPLGLLLNRSQEYYAGQKLKSITSRIPFSK